MSLITTSLRLPSDVIERLKKVALSRTVETKGYIYWTDVARDTLIDRWGAKGDYVNPCKEQGLLDMIAKQPTKAEIASLNEESPF